MAVSLLYLDDCPNWRIADQRLRRALEVAGRRGTPIRYIRISTPAEASAAGFAGSPTILIDGLDPFAPSNAAIGPALACRLFPTEDGLAGSPTVAQLVAVLT
jgi:hypothetical protein